MSSKKYFWLKLKDDFFKSKEIKKLRKIAGGDTYTIIYLKMQLLSIKNEGKLIFEGIEENFIEELALELDEPAENIEMTLNYLRMHNLIESCEQDEYLLPKVLESIGKESVSAERVRKHRALKNEEKKALQCNSEVTFCNTEIEIEKDIEKDIDLLTKQQIEKLNETFNEIDYKFYLEKIKSYGKEKNKVYKDFYITIMNWARRDILKNGSYYKIIHKKDNSLKINEKDWSETDWT